MTYLRSSPALLSCLLRLMAKFSGQLGRLGLGTFWSILNFICQFWESGRGPIGYAAPSRFKILDSQPEKSNMGPVWTDFHDFEHFQKSCRGFPARYLPCFRPGAPKTRFSSFLTGIKKMRDEKLCRFVVVSPREVPSLPVSCPFEILNSRSFLKVRSLSRSQTLQKSVH